LSAVAGIAHLLLGDDVYVAPTLLMQPRPVLNALRALAGHRRTTLHAPPPVRLEADISEDRLWSNGHDGGGGRLKAAVGSCGAQATTGMPRASPSTAGATCWKATTPSQPRW
jgi:hypothetical protein